jgi:8-oxo-dGTP pyrophosphatase MutT (NUDIX family)
MSYLNPAPVVAVLVPVDNGVLVIRRGIEPHKGELALPTGYINMAESWQEAGAREVFEETGVCVDPQEIKELDVKSTEDAILIFGITKPRTSNDLPSFEPNDEITERIILQGPEKLAFQLHTDFVRAFLEKMAPTHNSRLKSGSST